MISARIVSLVWSMEFWEEGLNLPSFVNRASAPRIRHKEAPDCALRTEICRADPRRHWACGSFAAPGPGPNRNCWQAAHATAETDLAAATGPAAAPRAVHNSRQLSMQPYSGAVDTLRDPVQDARFTEIHPAPGCESARNSRHGDGALEIVFHGISGGKGECAGHSEKGRKP